MRALAIQMVRFYAEELLEHNDQPLDEGLLVTALSNLFDFEDGDTGTSLDDYRYPAPDVPHRAGQQAQLRKIKQAHAETGSRANLYPTVHGYGPLNDFETRLQLAWDAGTPGIWINRYCYLGEKNSRRLEDSAYLLDETGIDTALGAQFLIEIRLLAR